MDIWKEGKYLDLWSVNHILSGIAFTGWATELGFSFWPIFITYVLLAIGWEIFEIVAEIHEYPGNKVMDVVTGILGLLLIYGFIMIDRPLSIYAISSLTILYIFMEVQGYFHYRKQSILKTAAKPNLGK